MGSTFGCMFRLLTFSFVFLPASAHATTFQVQGTFSGSDFIVDVGGLTSPLSTLSGSFSGTYSDDGLGPFYALDIVPTEVSVNGIPSLDVANSQIQILVSPSSLTQIRFGGTNWGAGGAQPGTDDLAVSFVGENDFQFLVYTLSSVPPDGPTSGNGRFRAQTRAGSYSITVVPEPSTALSVGLGLFAMGIRDRRPHAQA